MPSIYPFTAVVGQERMRRALVLNAVDPRIGGVLIRGERGTAKSTAARALAALLPNVTTVEDCRFGCDPTKPATWCTECRDRVAKGETLKSVTKRTPFINLPVSATEDRVVGTLDIEKAIQKGVRAFEPGVVLAAANTADCCTLTKSTFWMTMWWMCSWMLPPWVSHCRTRRIISFMHPARFILVGTMNPEEGDLRPQLLDRFALSVEISGIRDTRERVSIMERNLAFEADAAQFRQEWQGKEDELTKRIENGRNLVDQVTHTSQNLLSIAALTASLNVDGHRSDLVILKTARAQAAFEGRTSITDRDIALAAELALPHRLKSGLFQREEMGMEELQERIEQLSGGTPSGTQQQKSTESSEDESASSKKA